MLGLRGSFLGFTFNGIHSSILGITRTTSFGEGENLTPSFTDKKIQVRGSNATLFQGAVLGSKQFKINFAFDKSTEEQMLMLKRLVNLKSSFPLIFDECPYKVYQAKIQGDVILKIIPFGIDGARYYSGTGSITLQTLGGYAKSRMQYLEDYTADNITEWCIDEDLIDSSKNQMLYNSAISYGFQVDDVADSKESQGGLYITDETFETYFYGLDSNEYQELDTPKQVTGNSGLIFGLRMDPIYYNLNEWSAASRIPSKARYEKYETLADNKKRCKFYNAGDAEMPIEFIFGIPSSSNSIISITHNGNTITIKDLVAKGEDKYFGVNTQEFQIIGYNTRMEPTKNYYNDYLEKRDFFLLPCGESEVEFEGEVPIYNKFKYLYL